MANDVKEQLAVAIREYNQLEADHESLRLQLESVRQGRRQERAVLIKRINELRAENAVLRGPDTDERDGLITTPLVKRIQELRAELRNVRHALTKIEGDRVALAAVIEAARDGYAAGDTQAIGDTLMAQVTSDAALREIRAKAWDESALALDMNAHGAGIENPYRDEVNHG